MGNRVLALDFEQENGLHRPLSSGEILPEGCDVALGRHVEIVLARGADGSEGSVFEFTRRLTALRVGVRGRKQHYAQGYAKSRDGAAGCQIHCEIPLLLSLTGKV